MDPFRRALADRSAPFDFDLVRSCDVARRFGLTRQEATAAMRGLGAEQMPRATSGGVPAYRLWAVRDADAWRRRTPSARLRAFEAHRAAAFDPLEM